MPYLKAYADEAARWPQLTGQAGLCSPEEAALALRKLSRHYKLRNRIALDWTTGRNYSRAGERHIKLNVEHLCWRIVAHEFAHCWLRQGAWAGKWERPVRAHGRLHRKLTDRACRYVLKMGWHHGALAHQVAVTEAHREHRERAAAQPPPLDARIAKRQEQCARLERKVKALTTRLKRARRSLAALERQQVRQRGA